MKVSPRISLNFNGQCAAAFKFYAHCFGGKFEPVITWGDSPMAAQAPPEWAKKILHARAIIGDTVLMGSDAPPNSYQQPQGFCLVLDVDDLAEGKRVFHALAENGTVTVPIQKTFWTAGFGALIDRFGIPWEIHCEAE